MPSQAVLSNGRSMDISWSSWGEGGDLSSWTAHGDADGRRGWPACSAASASHAKLDEPCFSKAASPAAPMVSPAMQAPAQEQLVSAEVAKVTVKLALDAQNYKHDGKTRLRNNFPLTCGVNGVIAPGLDRFLRLNQRVKDQGTRSDYILARLCYRAAVSRMLFVAFLLQVLCRTAESSSMGEWPSLRNIARATPNLRNASD